MNALKPNTLVILTALSAISPLVHSAELALATALADTPDPGAQPVMTFKYRNLVVNNLAEAELAADQASTFGESAKALWNATSIRSNAISVAFPRKDMFMRDDRAAFSVYAPMQAVNGALSFAGYVAQSRLNDSLVTLSQVLSFAARRQINAEFAYSVKTDKFSKFESSIIGRLNSGADPGKPDVVVGVRYSIKF